MSVENSKNKNDLLSIMPKRSSMLLYSDSNDQYSHRVRIVLSEKGVSVEIFHVRPDEVPEEVLALNPYQALPTLVDRELVLYQPNVIMEYLDERFPHPPLLPVYPVARAHNRLWVHRVEKDWCPHVDKILDVETSAEEAAKSRQILRESLLAVSPIFSEKPFFMSDEFTLIDCCVAPILWRLDRLEIELPKKQAKDLITYAERLFQRDAFQVSLSDVERERGGWSLAL